MEGAMRCVATVGSATLTIDLEDDGAVRAVRLDGDEKTVDWRAVGGRTLSAQGERAGHYSLLIGDRSYEMFIRAMGRQESGASAFEVSIGGQTFEVGVQDERARTLASLVGEARTSGDVTIRAPMPGLVSNVLVAEGDAVQRGQAVVVLEAMKMENDLSATRAGIVKSLRVAKGQTVAQGEALALIGEPAGAASDETDDTLDENGE
jgi:biotin carboxyl carrier protein